MEQDETEFVTIEINIPDDLLLQLAIMAHERDITLNTLIVDILERSVNHLEKINAKTE